MEVEILGQAAAERTREAVLAQANNPDLQEKAEQGLRSASASDADQENEASGGAMLKRVGAKKRARGGDYLSAEAVPATPAQIMEGLLLGSPDFQRR
jgi:hypothetical protein